MWCRCSPIAAAATSASSRKVPLWCSEVKRHDIEREVSMMRAPRPNCVANVDVTCVMCVVVSHGVSSVAHKRKACSHEYITKLYDTFEEFRSVGLPLCHPSLLQGFLPRSLSRTRTPCAPCLTSTFEEDHAMLIASNLARAIPTCGCHSP